MAGAALQAELPDEAVLHGDLAEFCPVNLGRVKALGTAADTKTQQHCDCSSLGYRLHQPGCYAADKVLIFHRKGRKKIPHKRTHFKRLRGLAPIFLTAAVAHLPRLWRMPDPVL